MISTLADFWDEVLGDGSEGSGKFVEGVFGPMWREGPTGALQEKEIENWESQEDELKEFGLLQTAFTACGYAIDAMKAEKAGHTLEAWKFLASANYWLGATVGAWSLRKDRPLTVQELAVRGAASRHAENRAMKAEVFAWMDEHNAKYRSLDSAAEAIANKVAPIKFRTARDWIGEWKKLRSAGTPFGGGF
ncbi:hypothetical protein FFI97_001690 [Variovorax sp. KBS0712]|uniref:hypothetical protein n=1 Tax=Variovorax sp. KBS0712 TaxID=2578111 RepID=UPI0011189EDE|nr:hypothetical protein [Variovorax sp. KBS0712]TSD59070.1 hypothetical protein FFI97_001690 [Variovorax sp. KBS0712]